MKVVNLADNLVAKKVVKLVLIKVEKMVNLKVLMLGLSKAVSKPVSLVDS